MVDDCQTKTTRDMVKDSWAIDPAFLVARSHRRAYTYLTMEEVVKLGRAKIVDYLACPRRFQLRYLERSPWPAGRQDPKGERSRELGQRFHTVLHRHFLGIHHGDEVQSVPELRRWWRLFQTFEPQIPAGHLKSELSLTVPIGGLSLTGRFDLLVVSGEGVHVFDWKTYGRARSTEELRRDLQSKIYLALAAESGSVLKREVRAEDVTLTYWFATDPPVIVKISYGRREHFENWSYLKAIANEIESRQESKEPWPLTDALEECRRCAFQILCGRGPGNPDLVELDDLVGWTGLVGRPDHDDSPPIEPALP
jgi:CRISPR/Cas system-associated exonuclease Cas4 (RecB family)